MVKTAFYLYFCPTTILCKLWRLGTPSLPCSSACTHAPVCHLEHSFLPACSLLLHFAYYLCMEEAEFGTLHVVDDRPVLYTGWK
jgi:hypothetical protein